MKKLLSFVEKDFLIDFISKYIYALGITQITKNIFMKE
jgi:hypothetical protein